MARARQVIALRIGSYMLLVLGVAFLAACGGVQPAPETEAEALADIETYRQQRLDELRQPDGWLALVGLYWLREGENTFGGDTENDLVFPGADIPPRLGTFILQDSTVRVRIEPGAGVLHGNQPVDTLMLVSDATETPTSLERGTLSWYIIDREGRLGVRLKDSASPALAAFDGINTYPVDLAWRLRGRFEPYDPPLKVAIPNIMGGAFEETVPGAVAFERDGRIYRLDVTGEPTDSTFFVIFSDLTNGKTTYNGGRYLWIDAPDQQGSLTIDFNKAYNPPCVFTPYATCPLPPRQNRLAVAVEAGEKTYKH